MQPQTAATDGQRADGFQPKYRHFPPTDRVWVKNPFQHDIVYQVADEYNRPFRYRLPAGKVSELPGGAIATLGVKQIIDELIQNSATNTESTLLMWDAKVRAKHEAEVILKVTSMAPKADLANPGEINLGSSTPDDAPVVAAPAPAAPEEAFPGLNQPAPAATAAPQEAPAAAPSLPPAPAPRQQLPQEADQGIRDVVAASLPSNNVVIGANADHASAE